MPTQHRTAHSTDAGPDVVELARATRPTPCANIACFVDKCKFSKASWRSVETHVRTMHLNIPAFTSTLEPFPPTASAAVGRTTGRRPIHTTTTDDDDDQGTSSNPSSSERSRSPRPVRRVRSTRPQTAMLSIPPTTAARPYPARIPSRSRSRSPSVSPTKPSTTGFSTPTFASPLGQPPFSRAPSPEPTSEEEEVDDHKDGEQLDSSHPHDDDPGVEVEDDAKDGEGPMDVDAIDPLSEAQPALDAASLRVITLTWLPRRPQFIACRECKVGISAKVALKHCKGHNIVLSDVHREALTEYLENADLAADKDKLPPPAPNGAPIDGLAITAGFKCTHCPYSVATAATMMSHFSREHRGVQGTYTQNSTPASIQTYFSGTHSPSFAVDVVRAGLASDDLYLAYLNQHAAAFERSTLLNKAISSSEVPPLLRVMLWHEHLEPLIGSKHNVDGLLALTQLPTSVRGIDWLGAPLRHAAIAYLHDTAKLAGRSHISVRCLLHECPRLTQHGQYWQPLTNEQSISKYAGTVHKWIHAILVTLEPGAPSTYRFPLNNGDKVRAKALKAALQANKGDDAVLPLHRFLKPFLYPLDRTGQALGKKFSRWDEPIECLQAITTLKEDGTFKEPRDVTQMFAQIAYHIRAAILYEASLNVAAFHGDLYKLSLPSPMLYTLLTPVFFFFFFLFFWQVR